MLILSLSDTMRIDLAGGSETQIGARILPLSHYPDYTAYVTPIPLMPVLLCIIFIPIRKYLR
jgi:hypothetical protein